MHIYNKNLGKLYTKGSYKLVYVYGVTYSFFFFTFFPFLKKWSHT